MFASKSSRPAAFTAPTGGPSKWWQKARIGHVSDDGRAVVLHRLRGRPFHGRRNRAGGTPSSHTAHFYDLIRFVLSPPKPLTSTPRSRHSATPYPGLNTMSQLRFDGGVGAALDEATRCGSRVAQHPAPLPCGGESGIIDFDLRQGATGGTAFGRRVGNSHRSTMSTGRRSGPARGLFSQTQAFIDDVLDDRPGIPCPAATAARRWRW